MGLFDHVQPGDRQRIKASTWNALLDAAAKARGGPEALAEAKRGRASNNIVPVRNGSAGDLDRFAILGLDEPVFDPTDEDALPAFKNTAAFDGIEPADPDHVGRFVILLEPAKAGAIVPGLLAGVTPVQVDVTDEAHAFADVADGETGHLKSGESGAAQILWPKSPAVGLQWAVVRVGPPSVDKGCWARLKDEESPGSAIYTARRLLDDAETDADVEAADLTNVKEVNGVSGIPVGEYGTVVWLERDETDDPPEWRFACPLFPPTNKEATQVVVFDSADGKIKWVELKDFTCPS